MSEALFILNAGSSSLKFSVFRDGDPPEGLVRGQMESLATRPRFIARDGLSYEYVASILPRVDRRAAAGRTIVAHLGNGCSMCAMKEGRSVATTMGFTPLEGCRWEPARVRLIPAC